MSETHRRKEDHIDLCHTGDVDHPSELALFGEVALVHDALPELSLEGLLLETRFIDHTLAVPLMVTGMTGGPPRAGEINRALARICEQQGLAFGVGSQRFLTRDGDDAAAAAAEATFQVREAAPSVVLLGNIGVMQAKALGPARVAELVERIGADYLAVHLNPAMELVQPGSEADRDFCGGYDAIGRLLDSTGGRVVVKECGAGLSPKVIARLAGLGVRCVDVSGAGGTDWVRVEALRAKERGENDSLGRLFAGWGIPTAAAVASAAGLGPQVVASGGIGDGLAAAKALALGAHVVGFARPVLQAFLNKGEDGALAFIEGMIEGLRMALLLTGSRSPEELRRAPRVIGPHLRSWIDALGTDR